jgi:hypothetical protein
MRYKFLVLALATVSSASAQANLSGYQGPGVSSPGVGDIGTKSGEQVDLRLWGGVSGVYDTYLQPVITDSKGNLITIRDLYGVEASLGAYGVHSWRRAQLGLNYTGSFHHYANNSFYDGSEHALNLGYTFQKSRQWVFNLKQSAGTYSFNTGGVATSVSSDFSSIVTPAAALFDTRTYYLDSSVNITWMPTARTSYTFGGSGNKIIYRSNALASMNGYTLNGDVNHIVTRNTSVGVSYAHTHYDYPNFFGESDINTFEGTYGAIFDRVWTFTLRGGIFVSESRNQAVNLNPALAAFLKTKSLCVPPLFCYSKSTNASGSAELKRQFKRANLSFQFSRAASPGNGVFLASRFDSATVRFSYTGLRKLNFGMDGSYYGTTSLGTLTSQGTGIPKDNEFSAGSGLSYELVRAVHLTARYDLRHQELDLGGYKRSGYRVAFGMAFSPGNIPLSLW